MYITRVEIENIRSIKHLVWDIADENAPRWHVILGDNGSGKSTFVRSVALAVLGIEDARVLRINIDDFVNHEVLQTNFEASTTIEILLHKKYGETTPAIKSFKMFALMPKYFGDDRVITGFEDTDITKRGEKSFAVSFGSFRRFTGGYPEDDKLHKTHPLLSRHLSVFSERTALTEPLKWLQEQQFKSLEGDAEAKKLLENVKAFVNQKGFLPYGAQLTEVTSAGVRFRDGNGNAIFVEDMSDGYRSVLSLTFELLRQLSIAYGADIFEAHDDDKITVKVPGVVQIDEVDAHLHPTWQRRIGFWFREHFPAMQFIVTTHSPLVCQAAEQGSIFLLPRPGTNETGRMLEGEDRDRLLYGDILDAYSTEAFGGGETRSKEGQKMLDRLADLNIKELRQGLTKTEKKEQEGLRRALPTAATILPEMP